MHRQHAGGDCPSAYFASDDLETLKASSRERSKEDQRMRQMMLPGLAEMFRIRKEYASRKREFKR